MGLLPILDARASFAGRPSHFSALPPAAGGLRFRITQPRRIPMLLLLLFVGCPAPDPTAGLPSAGFLSLTSAAAKELSACLARFPESPAAAAGERLTAAAEACPGELYGEGERAWEALRCSAPPQAVAALRQDRDLAMGSPRSAAGIAHAEATVRPDAVNLDATLPLPDEAGPLGLLLPGGDPAGPAVLSGQGAVLHARARPAGGIDLGAFVSAGSHADSLFDLKAELLSATVLSGWWELALYPPGAGGELPWPVLAVGVRAATADAAVDAFVEEVRAKWGVQRQATTIAGAPGECLGGLKIMPGFEPCYARREDTLAIGWNAEALAGALAGPPADLGLAGASGARLDFGAMKAADALLASGKPADTLYPPLDYPLGTVTIRLLPPEGGALRLRATSTAGCGP